MFYDWTEWLDHVTDPSNVFRLESLGGDLYRITLAGTVMQQGTPQDQTRFNNVESGIVDAHGAASLLLNFARQIGWDKDDVLAWIGKVNIVYYGTTELTNSEEFPFNNSLASVSIGATLDNAYYEVQTKVVEAYEGMNDIKETAAFWNVGEIEVSDKLTNGFKLSYAGSAAKVKVAWAVIPQTAVMPGT